MLGMGLNVLTREFPAELARRPRRRSRSRRRRPSSAWRRCWRRCCATLEHRATATRGEVLAAWRQRDAAAGPRISWGGGEGTAAGIDDSGALLVDTGDGHVALHAGEVHLG